MTGPDARAERERWRASAASWNRWADPIAAMADKLNGPLLDAAGVGPGARLVVDLASGAGEPALGAARRLGPGGLVAGLDLVPEMLAGARRRAAGLTQAGTVGFAAADMTALPLADGSADAITCRFGIMFVPQAGRALAECRRALRPGGRAAFMVWGPKAGNTQFVELEAAVEAALGPDHGPGLAPLFRFAEPGGLEDLVRAAGFSAVEATDLAPVRRVPLDPPFWEAGLEMGFAPRLAGLDRVARAELDRGIRARFAALAAEGSVPVRLHARIVVGVA